ncbi:lipid-A-disaccharide synthase [gamma proteobacterium HTCC5015]|nr:lipid-A-disaccharide synthase [gamma proteobacterium HTCC5015]
MSQFSTQRKIMISAGEASGDLHAAKLVKALRQQDPAIEVAAMGAEQLRRAGAEILVDCRDIAVVGLVEVLTHWSQIQAALKTLKIALKDQKPDLLILVDYVEFNLKLAAAAKELGIKVLFYVSPQVWAWRQGRVPKIGKVIDMMAVIFPFETDIYEQNGVPVRYVGHPLASEVAATKSRESFRKAQKLDTQHPLIALLPGSRRSEVTRILPVMLEAAERVAETLPHSQFLIAVADTLDSDWIQAFIKQHPKLDIKLLQGDTYNAVHAADSALVASGTATLETALLGTPMSIVYRVNGLSYQILKRMIKVDFIGLANIVAGRQVAPEFVQDYANPWLIALEVVKQVSNPPYRDDIIEGLKEVAEKLGEGGGTQKLAQLVFELLDE